MQSYATIDTHSQSTSKKAFLRNLARGEAYSQEAPVLWDVVSGDPSPRITASTMIRNVVDQTRAGSIIIFHVGSSSQDGPALQAVALPPVSVPSPNSLYFATDAHEVRIQ